DPERRELFHVRRAHLPFVVVAPAPEVEVTRCCARVRIAQLDCGDRGAERAGIETHDSNGAVAIRRHAVTELAPSIVAPTPDGMVVLQRTSVHYVSPHVHDIGQGFRLRRRDAVHARAAMAGGRRDIAVVDDGLRSSKAITDDVLTVSGRLLR